jgi:RNA polymerase sigma factor (sigma-70 family)
MSTDAELLHRYVEDHDERAFAELVLRHLGLVYSAALRRTGGRTHLAEDIAQKVFSDLARKAAVLTHHPALTGWLYRSTRYAAIDAARAELRRQKLAQSLTAMPDQSSPPESPADWERLRPVLDEAMDQLKECDREIMLLRYFNGLTFGEVGARLNLTENTARMRAERALDKLRGHSNHGQATAHDAALTFAWACDISDPSAFTNLIYFEGKRREKALAVLATMPESIRAQFSTPEAFYGLLLAASTLEGPPPGADLMQRLMVEVELSPGRVAVRRVGSSVNFHEYQQTSDGWKFVLPKGAVKALPGVLNSETLARLAKQ